MFGCFRYLRIIAIRDPCFVEILESFTRIFVFCLGPHESYSLEIQQKTNKIFLEYIAEYFLKMPCFRISFSYP